MITLLSFSDFYFILSLYFLKNLSSKAASFVFNGNGNGVLNRKEHAIYIQQELSHLLRLKNFNVVIYIAFLNEKETTEMISCQFFSYLLPEMN